MQHVAAPRIFNLLVCIQKSEKEHFLMFQLTRNDTYLAMCRQNPKEKNWNNSTGKNLLLLFCTVCCTQQKKIINILYEKQHHHVWALSAQYLHARYFLLIAFTMVVVYLQDCKIHFATLSWTSKRKPPTTEIKGVNPGNRHLNPCTQLPKVMAYLQFLMSNSHRESS